MIKAEERTSSVGGAAITAASTATSSNNNNNNNNMIMNQTNNAELNATTNHTTQTNNNNPSSSIPKCFCTWKNCRAYQKAWRESNHHIYDGVIKIKFIKGHIESMALKSCIDRILTIPESKSNEWKISTTNNASPGTGTNDAGQQPQEHIRYVIARHHFTEKHILKYLQDPKTFSFLKPFSIHGATKYLYSINRMDTLQNSNKDGIKNEDNTDDNSLYLQAPNVPKDVVKEEFYRVMEKIKSNKANSSPQKNTTATTNNNNGPTTSVAPSTTGNKSKQGKNGTNDLDSHLKNANYTNQKKDSNSSVTASLHHKEIENRILKDQLDAMKSQLTFLHDMVQKLQEQHLSDQQSVYTGRSSRYHGGGNSSRKSINHGRNGGDGRRTSAGTGGGGPNGKRRSITLPSTGGVPHEIELGDDDESQTYWKDEATEGDWTDNYNSESNDMDDDEQTTNTFQVAYRLSRHGSGSSVTSKAASTIVSASKSVKTLPREIELDEDDSDSHESLQEEAFDNRSFASSAHGNVSINRHSRRSFVSDINHNLHGSYNSSSTRGGGGGSGSNNLNYDNFNQDRFGNATNVKSGSTTAATAMSEDHPQYRGPSAMNAGTHKSIGPNSKKPSRRISNGSTSISQGRKMSTGTNDSSNSGDTGTYEVKDMIVTDPYGEKGLYTGSISSSTGMPNGYGRLEYDKAGRWYEGDWKHGRWTGRGQLSNGDGDFYEGGLKNDHKHGMGKMKFADGRMFEGEYINGQMVDGKMTYQDGSTYSGTWVDGMRHGRGRCVFTDESIYEGEFKEGEFYGYGKMSWNDGGWYEGSWLNGDMHGRGREVRADGTLRHDGEWLKGQPIRNKKSSS
jgi:MORN repeat